MANNKRLESLVKAKAEKPSVLGPAPVKVSKNTDVSALQDAIVGGKLLAKVGDTILVVRVRDGKKGAWSVCKVMKVDEANGLVDTYDETVQQFFTFRFSGVSAPATKLYASVPEQI